jgi:hypothetical protein
VINATGLNNGEIVLFPTQDNLSGASVRDLILSKTATRYFLEKNRNNLPMPASTPIARAVAASSAIPGVFAPIKLTGALDRTPWPYRHIWGESSREDSFRAIDGGVTDNQGAFLIASICDHLIVSDGAASLKEDVHPSTWQLWPPGRGVFFRAQNIIFERVRELGYRRLRDWQGLRRDLRKALDNCGLDADTIDGVLQGLGMTLVSYSYVELEPCPELPLGGGEAAPAGGIDSLRVHHPHRPGCLLPGGDFSADVPRLYPDRPLPEYSSARPAAQGPSAPEVRLPHWGGSGIGTTPPSKKSREPRGTCRYLGRASARGV